MFCKNMSVSSWLCDRNLNHLITIDSVQTNRLPNLSSLHLVAYVNKSMKAFSSIYCHWAPILKHLKQDSLSLTCEGSYTLEYFMCWDQLSGLAKPAAQCTSLPSWDEDPPLPNSPVHLPSRISLYRIQIDLGICQHLCWSTDIFWR